MNGQQLAKRVGATYRQIDHWTTNGYLRARQANPGSGNQRTYTGREVEVAALMVALVKQGVEPKAAARVARPLLSRGTAALGRRFVISRKREAA